MLIATTGPITNDPPSTRPPAPPAEREALADTVAKRKEPDADDVGDDAYDLACTD